MSTHKKNVLWIGDSLSIGMTPHLAEALQDIALVQHAPWDTTDGGAEETAYSKHCINYYLHSPSGESLDLDLIIVNFGMHDGPLGNDTIPGQNAPPTHYAEELTEILDRLVQYKKNSKKDITLVYALTTAFLCSLESNGCVQNLNNQAFKIAKERGFEILDVYSPLVEKCGPIPNKDCGGVSGAWCPHNPSGYHWLVTTVVAPETRKLFI